MAAPFEVVANTFSGDIKFNQALPATVKTNTNRYGPGRSVRGSVGGGGAYVEDSPRSAATSSSARNSQ